MIRLSILLGAAVALVGGQVPEEALPKVAKPIAANSAGIGSQIPTWRGSDIAGNSVKLGGQPTVIALTSSSCPLCLKQGPALARLEDEFAGKVKFIFLNPTGSDTHSEIKADIKKLGLNGQYVTDPDLARQLKAKTTTETFFFDGRGTLRYRGAIDDQYGLSSATAAPKNSYLASAIRTVLAGREPKVAATSSPGCLLNTPEPTGPPAVTYHNQISRLMQKHCLECHRKGGVAPFSLEDYQSLKSRAAMIQGVVKEGIMPPWFASDKGHSPWKNDRTIPAAAKVELLTWLSGPMLEGNVKEAPPKFVYNPEWKIGTPDVVYGMTKPIAIKADGIMPYQTVLIQTDQKEDKWIQKLEVQPTARQVVHHVLIFIVPANGSGRGFDGFEEISGFFAAYVPGNSTLIYPDGFAKRLPAGSKLKFQIHYTPNGTATQDTTRLGMVFAKSEPKHEVHTVGIVNLGLSIPPGAPKHPVSATLNVPRDARILSLMPHMHVRGAACRYDLIRGSERTTLLDIPRYDFNWQLAYDYRDPLLVSNGDKVEFTAWYDNSPNNPNNPDPTKRVNWGLQTADEMHLGYMEYYFPNEKPGDATKLLRGINFRS